MTAKRPTTGGKYVMHLTISVGTEGRGVQMVEGVQEAPLEGLVTGVYFVLSWI